MRHLQHDVESIEDNESDMLSRSKPALLSILLLYHQQLNVKPMGTNVPEL